MLIDASGSDEVLARVLDRFMDDDPPAVFTTDELLLLHCAAAPELEALAVTGASLDDEVLGGALADALRDVVTPELQADVCRRLEGALKVEPDDEDLADLLEVAKEASLMLALFAASSAPTALARTTGEAVLARRLFEGELLVDDDLIDLEKHFQFEGDDSAAGNVARARSLLSVRRPS